MTKQLRNVWALIAAITVLIYYLSLLNIDLASDAQAGTAYLFYGPPGIVPSIFAYTFVQTLFITWQNRTSRKAIVRGVMFVALCAALVVGPLIYTSNRFAVSNAAVKPPSEKSLVQLGGILESGHLAK